MLLNSHSPTLILYLRNGLVVVMAEPRVNTLLSNAVVLLCTLVKWVALYNVYEGSNPHGDFPFRLWFVDVPCLSLSELMQQLCYFIKRQHARSTQNNIAFLSGFSLVSPVCLCVTTIMKLIAASQGITAY